MFWPGYQLWGVDKGHYISDPSTRSLCSLAQDDTGEQQYVLIVWSLMPGGRGLLLFGGNQIVFVLYLKGGKMRVKTRKIGKNDEKLTGMNMLKNKGNIAFLVKL